MNNIEHKEIYNIVQDRAKTPKSDYLSMDDMAKNLILIQNLYKMYQLKLHPKIEDDLKKSLIVHFKLKFLKN